MSWSLDLRALISWTTSSFSFCVGLQTLWCIRKICLVFELRSSALSRELDRAFARLRACGTAVWRSLNVFWVPKVRKFRLCFHFRRDLGVGSVQKTVRSSDSLGKAPGTSTCSWSTALGVRSGSSALVSPIVESQR